MKTRWEIIEPSSSGGTEYIALLLQEAVTRSFFTGGTEHIALLLQEADTRSFFSGGYYIAAEI